MPNPVVALIGAGASIISGAMGSRAASKAAKAQERGADAATAAQLEMYYQSREDLAPWREAGGRAINRLEGLIKAGPGEFTEDPGYQFRLGEGVKTLERGAAARGGQLSGAQGKALTRFGQEYGTGEYQNFLNRYYQKLNPYLSIAGMGQVSAGQTAQTGMQTGTNIGQNLLYRGQTRASGYMNQANIYNEMLGTGANAFLYYNMLRGGGGGYGGAGAGAGGGGGGWSGWR